MIDFLYINALILIHYCFCSNDSITRTCMDEAPHNLRLIKIINGLKICYLKKKHGDDTFSIRRYLFNI